jgi:hypothetical protein
LEIETKRSPAPVLQAIRGSPAMWSPKTCSIRGTKKLCSIGHRIVHLSFVRHGARDWSPARKPPPVSAWRSLSPRGTYRASLGFGSSILARSSINLGSAFTDYSLFFFRARVCSGPSFLCRSPVCTRPLLSVAHRASPLVDENRSGTHYRGLQARDSFPARGIVKSANQERAAGKAPGSTGCSSVSPSDG